MPPFETGTEFVAISHVWSDGHGTPSSNTVPTCFLEYLTSLVNKLPNINPYNQFSFWMDTICVPRAPKSAKKLALLRLKDPYVLAIHVLVLDSYLSTLYSKQMSPIEMLARVQASGWMQRLWTFQEGRLSQRLWVQFKDQAHSMFDIVDQWRGDFYRIPSLASHAVDLEIVGTWSASSVLPGAFFDDRLKQIPYIRQALSRRGTSRAEDEALCLAKLMDLDISKILEAKENERMLAFRKLVPQIPAGLAFSKATRKLCELGYRWAPASFMGDSNVKRWGGPGGLFSQLDASSSRSGLAVRLSSFRFRPLHEEIPALFSPKENLLNLLQTSTTTWKGGIEVGNGPFKG